MASPLQISVLSFLALLSIISHGFVVGLVRVGDSCEYSVVQSMPDKMQLKDPAGVVPTHVSLLDIVENAKESLRIASFYWWLTAPKKFSAHPTAVPGQKLMEAISMAAVRGVKVEVVLDKSGRHDMSNPDDIKSLEQQSITLKYLNMSHLLHAGVMHSKFIIADNRTLYVGSSNFDWRSYVQIKEIGLTFKNCPQLAQDLDKIFKAYMLISDQNKVPDTLPDDLKTSLNLKTPLVMDDIKLFLAGSPPPFNGANDTTGRTDDIDGLLHILNKARHKVDISVMNYSPRMEFVWPRKYWPRIDDALRRAAIERHVQVRLLFSDWAQSKPLDSVWYHSLNAIQSKDLRGGGIHVKLFKVPAFDDFQKSIPFARVKHDKYMVTDNGLYVGTSNWSADYFTNTCGVGVVIEPNNSRFGNSSGLIKTMQEIFERDFNSEYARDLN